MKTLFWLPKAVCKVSNPLAQRLDWSSLASALVMLIASAWPATAKVVYTPVNVTLSGNGSIGMDVNRDGKNDFTIQASSHRFPCGVALETGIFVDVTISPMTIDNGIVVKGLTNFGEGAALLPHGVQINSRANFYKAQAVINHAGFCPGSTYIDRVSGYLGLEFQINAKTHYGWALVNVFATRRNIGGDRLIMETTLIGFAYETIPGSPINTGQTSDLAADPGAADPGSTNREPDPSCIAFNLGFCQGPEVRLRVEGTTKYFSAVSQFLSDFRLSTPMVRIRAFLSHFPPVKTLAASEFRSGRLDSQWPVSVPRLGVTRHLNPGFLLDGPFYGT